MRKRCQPKVLGGHRGSASEKDPRQRRPAGSLHRFRAVRGTIITTAGFAKGTTEAAFEAGAAPITLIDGQKLVDLLIENSIGAKVTKFELLTLDRSAFENTEGTRDETR